MRFDTGDVGDIGNGVFFGKFYIAFFSGVDLATALTRPLRLSCDINILVSICFFSDLFNCKH